MIEPIQLKHMKTSKAIATLSKEEVTTAVMEYVLKSGLSPEKVEYSCEVKKKSLGPYDYAEYAILTGCTVTISL